MKFLTILFSKSPMRIITTSFSKRYFLSPHKIVNNVASFSDNSCFKLFGIPIKCFTTIPTSQVKLYFGKEGFVLQSPVIY